MVLGQSAATAAVMATDDNVPLQKLDYSKLRSRLEEDKQRLVWTGPKPQPPIEVSSLKGLVVDDVNAKLTGDWPSSRSIGGFVGHSYLHDGNAGKGEKSAVFTFTIQEPGNYEVRVAYTPNPNRATNVPVTIRSGEQTKQATVNQRKPPQHDKVFTTVGKFELAPGPVEVIISNKDTDGHVVIDAVQLLLITE